MSDTRHGPGDDGYYAALDFGDEPGQDGGAGLDFGDEAHYGDDDALDFGDEVSGDNRGQSVVETLDADQPAEFADAGTAHAIEILSEDTDHTGATGDPDDESSSQLVTVTNPAETVSVSAMATGEIHRVELAPEAGNMTASDLASEVLTIARLAQERGKAMFHTMLLRAFNEMGATDNEAMTGFMAEGMGLPSPEQAAKSQAAAFAARYGD